ncbi:hypothetical protein L2E82_01562 [Cichorium intybus]|uniref:Uncharacterized protein n=1 Tax=Cichorium intybus TaxID=13427 RepID=A0ACB9H0I9_CICIN|nr:hypothetical protein L2E82_01562 [Cichorium intybus]
MVFGLRRAFCTSVPRETDSVIGGIRDDSERDYDVKGNGGGGTALFVALDGVSNKWSPSLVNSAPSNGPLEAPSFRHIYIPSFFCKT